MATTAHLKKRAGVPLFLSCLIGTVLLGMLAGLFSGSRAGYASLVLPPATPPDGVFPIVWTVLYAMMGLSLFFIRRKPAFTTTLARDKQTATVLWAIQFAFNLIWPFMFFWLQLYTVSLLWLITLVAVNLAAVVYAFRTSPTAGALLVPYEMWLLFAAYLNLFIALLN